MSNRPMQPVPPEVPPSASRRRALRKMTAAVTAPPLAAASLLATARADAPVPQFDAKALSELDSIHEDQGKPADASGKPVPPHEGWGSGTVPFDGQDRSFTFGFIGDTPYNRLDQQGMKRVMAGLDDTDLEFVLHVGDIKSRGERCSDILLSDRVEMMDRSQHPLIYTPGDNEWTDCGWIDPDDPYAPGTPLERLHWLRSRVYHHPESLGARRMRVEQQRQMIPQLSVRDSNSLEQPRLPENMRWRIGSLQFCTIHVVGSNNAMFSTPAMREAWALRQQANAIWLTETAAHGGWSLPPMPTWASRPLATTAGRPRARPSLPRRPTSAGRWRCCMAIPTSSAPIACCCAPTAWKTSSAWSASARPSPGSG